MSAMRSGGGTWKDQPTVPRKWSGVLGRGHDEGAGLRRGEVIGGQGDPLVELLDGVGQRDERRHPEAQLVRIVQQLEPALTVGRDRHPQEQAFAR